MLTDPIADLLTRIRNGYRAHKERVDVPYSRMKEQIARVLVEQGYLRDVGVVGEGVRRTLRIALRYDSQRQPVITGIRRESRPSLRVYVGAKSIPQVRKGFGVAILSTPAGVLADRDARARNVGGEVLCSVW